MSNSQTVSKRSIAVATFNTALADRATVGDRAFRQTVLVGIESKTGVNRATAAAMYNFAKKAAVKNGLTTDFGRSAKTAAPVEVVVPAGRWQIIDKATGAVVGAAESRRKAQAAKQDGQVVRDSEKAS
jgi:hypothetical protein